MNKAESIHKRLLILESRELKLAKANKDGVFAFMVKDEHRAETAEDRSRYRYRYRRLHTLCQQISERKSRLYGRMLELIKPQIDALIERQMEWTKGDADGAKRRIRGELAFDDSLDDCIRTEAIDEIKRRQEQAKAWYVPRAKA